MVRFQEGESYMPTDSAYGPVRVLKRTPKCIAVVNESGAKWRMIVRTNAEGVEYATDSSVPKTWRFVFTYFADAKA